MSDRLYTSSDSDEILSALRFETKLEKYILARMAFALSIAIDGPNCIASNDISGSEMKRPTFVGADEVFLKAALSYVHKTTDITEDDFYSNKSLTQLSHTKKDHIDLIHQHFQL